MTKRSDQRARLQRAEQLADEMERLVANLEEISVRIAEELRHASA